MNIMNGVVTFRDYNGTGREFKALRVRGLRVLRAARPIIIENRYIEFLELEDCIVDNLSAPRLRYLSLYDSFIASPLPTDLHELSIYLPPVNFGIFRFDKLRYLEVQGWRSNKEPITLQLPELEYLYCESVIVTSLDTPKLKTLVLQGSPLLGRYPTSLEDLSLRQVDVGRLDGLVNLRRLHINPSRRRKISLIAPKLHELFCRNVDITQAYLPSLRCLYMERVRFMPRLPSNLEELIMISCRSRNLSHLYKLRSLICVNGSERRLGLRGLRNLKECILRNIHKDNSNAIIRSARRAVWEFPARPHSI